jgi:hypothetical protein
MRKLLIVLSFISFFFTACQKDNNPSPTQQQRELKSDSTTLTLPGIIGAKDSFNILSNGNWNIAINPATASWLKTSVSKGTGNTKVYVEVLENNVSGLSRTANIVITAEGSNVNPVKIPVTQRQNGQVTKTWTKVFGGTEADAFISFVSTPDGGWITVGTTTSNNGDISTNKGLEDIWVVRIDASGNKVWQKTYGTSRLDDGVSITKTSDGNYVFAFFSLVADGDMIFPRGGADIMVFKIDENGNKLWQRTVGGTSHDYTSNSNYITASSDGGCVLVGTTSSNDIDFNRNQGNRDVFAVKLDQTGNIVWQKTYGGSQSEAANAITPTKDGGYVIVGETQSTDGDLTENKGGTDVWVIKVDASGNKVWQKTFGGFANETANAITRASDDGFIIGGYSWSNGGDVIGSKGETDAWVFRLNASGNMVWQKTFGGTERDVAASIIKISSGYLIAGSSYSSNGDLTGNFGGADGWVFQIDESGKLLWQKNFGGSLNDRVAMINSTSDGSYLMVGVSLSPDGDMALQQGGVSDAWIMKFKDR